MAVTVEDFLAEYPELQSSGNSLVERAIARATQQCPESVWAERTDLGVMSLAAHRLTMRLYEIGGLAGMATDLAAGKSARAAMGGQDDLDMTTHGRQYKELRQQLPTTTGFTI